MTKNEKFNFTFTRPEYNDYAIDVAPEDEFGLLIDHVREKQKKENAKKNIHTPITTHEILFGGDEEDLMIELKITCSGRYKTATCLIDGVVHDFSGFKLGD
jgi:hypothetical protein